MKKLIGLLLLLAFIPFAGKSETSSSDSKEKINTFAKKSDGSVQIFHFSPAILVDALDPNFIKVAYAPAIVKDTATDRGTVEYFHCPRDYL